MNLKTLLSAFAVVALASHAVTAQTFSVTATNREEVRQFYNLVYDASENVPIGWTGSINGCNAGIISQAYLDATRLRVNFYRALAGAPTGVTFSNTYNGWCQQAALMFSANQAPNHFPPPTWSCLTTDGTNASAHSNINWGGNGAGPGAVDGWMDDAGITGPTDNGGHRRAVLYPPNLLMGNGSVPASTFNGTNYYSASALWVSGPHTFPAPATREPYVAWPPRGFIPYQLLHQVWTFSFPNADFSGATVTMTHSGTNVPVNITSATDYGYGDNTIVWVPNNLNPFSGYSWPNPGADDTWTVTVGNVLTNGVAGSFNYTVTVFDPAVGGADFHPPIVSGPSSPVLNQNNAYTFTAVSNATAYQWRSSKLVPTNIVDGAENGLVNFIASVPVKNASPYSPVTNLLVVSGSNGFHLTQAYWNDVNSLPLPQTLTVNRTLEPNAASQLTFKSQQRYTAGLQARVEVSTDYGKSWVAVFSEPGTNGSQVVFTTKNVDLSAYANQPVQIRFNLAFVNSLQSGFEPLGWFIDDVGFANFSDASMQITTDVTSGLGFNFNPTESADYELNVRPQFYGQSWGTFGPAKHVSTLTPTAPNIVSNPQPQSVSIGSTVNFTVTATGSTPLFYQWRLNQTNLTDSPTITGAQTYSLTLQNVQLSQAGSYDVIVTNSLGRQTSNPAALTFVGDANLANALDNNSLLWSTSGNANWFLQTTNTHDGFDAAQSGHITDNQSSTLQTPVTGPGTLTFWWQTSSEQGYDLLTFAVDGVNQLTNSGITAWSQQNVPITAGQHTLAWTYRKDINTAAGFDAGWVDQVVFTSSVIAQPTLGFSNSPPNLKLSWPGTATNFELQFKNSLSDSLWQTVPSGSISNQAGSFYFNTPTTNASRFFRLATP